MFDEDRPDRLKVLIVCFYFRILVLNDVTDSGGTLRITKLHTIKLHFCWTHWSKDPSSVEENRKILNFLHHVVHNHIFVELLLHYQHFLWHLYQEIVTYSIYIQSWMVAKSSRHFIIRILYCHYCPFCCPDIFSHSKSNFLVFFHDSVEQMHNWVIFFSYFTNYPSFEDGLTFLQRKRRFNSFSTFKWPLHNRNHNDICLLVHHYHFLLIKDTHSFDGRKR